MGSVALAARTAAIAVVDDDEAVRRLLSRWLGTAGYEVVECATAADARSIDPDRLALVLLDVRLGDDDGIEVLGELRGKAPDLPVVMVTAASGAETAVASLTAGARDYLVKPVTPERLLASVERALAPVRPRPHRTGEAFRRAIIGRSAALREVLSLVERVAPSEVAVAIRGETGTGKELVARAIHEHSRRREGPFIALNCAALSESLLETELFGHEKGSFTGASSRRLGCFEQARGGTLLLDEVGEMSPGLQVRLLRALQERTIRRVGGWTDVPVDVRIVSATHRDLEAEVRALRFRHDLYYRLVVFPIVVPPLRDRREDVPLIAEHVLGEAALATGGGPVRLDASASAALQAWDWPGNVRELQNVVMRARLACDGPLIRLEHLPRSVRHEAVPPPAAARESAEVISLREVERRQIERALHATGGNLTRAARLLGIGRATLYRKLEDRGVSSQGLRPRHPESSLRRRRGPRCSESACARPGDPSRRDPAL